MGTLMYHDRYSTMFTYLLQFESALAGGAILEVVDELALLGYRSLQSKLL